MQYNDVPISGGSGYVFNEAYAAELRNAGWRVAPSADGDFALIWVEADVPEEAEEQAGKFIEGSPRFEVVQGKAQRGSAPPWLIERHLGDGRFAREREVDTGGADDAIDAARLTAPGEYSVQLANGKGERIVYRLADDGTVTRVEP